jgi:hypothetical protein
MADPTPHYSSNISPPQTTQNPANQKEPTQNPKSGKKRYDSPIDAFILANLKKKTCLQDLIELYLKNNERKPTDRAFQKAAHKLADNGLIIITVSDQMWLFPSNEPDSSVGSTIANLHTAKSLFHDYKILVPILKDSKFFESLILPVEGIKKTPMRNWDVFYIGNSYHKLSVPMTIQKTTKSFVLMFAAKEFDANSQFFANIKEWVSKGYELAQWFLHNNGYVLDYTKIQVISQHISTPLSESIDEEIPDGEVITLDLGRKAIDAAFGLELRQKAKAWLDKSGGIAEIETNDKSYERKLLELPERAERTEKKVSELSNELRSSQDEIKRLSNVITAELVPAIQFQAETSRQLGLEIKTHLTAVQSIDKSAKTNTETMKAVQFATELQGKATLAQNEAISNLSTLMRELITKPETKPVKGKLEPSKDEIEALMKGG